MAAIGRFQKGEEIFHAKVVDGQLYRLQGDVFGSPSFERKPMRTKGVLTGTPGGIGRIESGDRLEVRIQGLAPLVNSVR